MRKRPITILAVIMAWLLLASTALAWVDIDVGAKEVYANGHEITVQGNDAGTKTVVTSNDPDSIRAGEEDQDVSDFTIYGGSKNKNVDGDTNVTIGDGATVGDVYGGGKNGDVNGSTNVTIDGGTTGDVYGGGHAIGGDANSSGQTGKNETANVSGSTNVTVNDGTTGDVYGGGKAEGGDASSNNIFRPSFGGDAQATVGVDTSVTIDGGTVEGSVYGGGNAVSGSAQGAALAGSANAKVKDDARVFIKDGTVTGTVTSGGKEKGLTANASVGDVATVSIEGGKIEGKKVYMNGGSKNQLKLKDPTALYYTYYFNIGFNINDLDVENGIVKDYLVKGKYNLGLSGGYVVLSFKDVPQPKTTSVTFYYKDGDAVKHEETRNITLDFWDSGFLVESSWDGNSVYNPTGGNATISYGDANQTVNIALTPLEDTVDVTFVYKYKGDEQHSETVTTEVTTTGGNVAVQLPTWSDDTKFEMPVVPPQSVNYGMEDYEVVINLVALKKTATATFNYIYKGSTLHTDVKKAEGLTFESEDVTLKSSWDDARFLSASGSATVGYNKLNEVVNIDLTPASREITVTFRYLYRDVVMHTDAQTVTVTYDAGKVTVTPKGFGLTGYHLLTDPQPVDVDFETEGNSVVIDILLRREGFVPETTTEVPLGPGTPQTIPLGLGIPSTGDTAGMRVLLMACGAALIAFVAIRARRSSSK